MRASARGGGPARTGPSSAGRIVRILAALLLWTGTSAAAAQTCLGRGIGGIAAHALLAGAAHASYDFDERVSGFDLGAEYWGNPRGAAAYSLGYVHRFMQSGAPDLDIVQGTVAAELPRIPALPPGGGVCLTGGAAAALAGDGSGGSAVDAYALPLGIAVGLTVPTGTVSRIYPYLHPRLVFGRSNTDLQALDISERYTTFAVEGGLGFARGPLVGTLRVLLGSAPDGVAVRALPDLRAGIEAGLRF